MKAGAYAYRDRKARKGEFRALWITRISAACRAQGLSYSTFTRGLTLAGVQPEPQGPVQPGHRGPRGLRGPGGEGPLEPDGSAGMISLEQIRLLEARINKAVELIRSLKDENKTLRRAVNAAQTRMRELEKLVGDFKSDQQEIEQCILRALENLDRLEEEVTEKKGRKERPRARRGRPGTGPGLNRGGGQAGSARPRRLPAFLPARRAAVPARKSWTSSRAGRWTGAASR